MGHLGLQFLITLFT